MTEMNKIWDDFAGELKKFILYRINKPMDADDILQDVFIKIHKNIDTLKDKTKIRSWVYQITRNTLIDYYRQQKITTDEFPDVDFYENLQEETPTELLAKAIRRMIDELPPIYSEPLCLNECHGIQQKEISERLGLSLSGIKSRIQRGRQMLKDDLMRCCHYEFDKYGTLIDYHKINCCCCKEKSAR